MNDALLDLGLLDQGRTLGAIDHVHGSAADHGAPRSACRQLCQGHSHRHRHILKRFAPPKRDADQGSSRVMVPATPPILSIIDSLNVPVITVTNKALRSNPLFAKSV
ncbi:hypothetical protein [uncultured Sphingomonas sp.]|uniref:hypothetical protein n=1 Tax=uncultured Sphingomonas sp. TaxID=158754 RepID=UPI0025CE0896|nr:hypothetical protein [uncultured Sphingomonas sp.]